MMTKLTPEQEARFPEFVEKWTKIGLCSDPADRPRAEAGIRLAYESAGLKRPERIVWCESPYAMIMARWNVAQGRRRGYVWGKVGTFVWSRAREAVNAIIDEGVREGVRANIEDHIKPTIYTHVRNRIHAGAHEDVGRSIQQPHARNHVWASVGACLSSQSDAHWLAMYDFFADVLGLKQETEPLRGMWEIAQAANWWLPCADACFICERPKVYLDERQRLHRDDGAAVEYPDGWSVYVWHGVRVPEHVILKPDEMAAQAIQHERNAEVRRVMLERFGEERYIRESNADIIDVDPRFGTLYRAPLLMDEPLVMVKVLNSTPESDGSRKSYFLRVPPETQTVREAVAWVAGFDDPNDYDPLIET
jgi:hypothetical protein